jgi:hypothetical protein
MEVFDIKKGLGSKIQGDKLGALMKDVFGNVDRDGEWFVSSYGAMMPIRAMMRSNTELAVEIVTVKVPDDQVLDSMRRRNAFLETATGFDSKTRLKRLKDKAKDGAL